MSKVLVVDDESGVRAAFQELLRTEGHDVSTAQSANDALASLRVERPDLIIMDICMPGMSGLEAMDHFKAYDRRLPVIVMTGFGTMDTAIEATKRGAFDYHLKPVDPELMLQTVERALQSSRVMEREVSLGAEMAPSTREALVGRSAVMQSVFKAIGRVAQTDATVLILGESGTGKELVARAIYQHSNRKAATLHILNCAAIPDALLESELFGYERGAFTGAESRRIGRLEQAAGGTLFLDEIAELPMTLQSKLLRVLQEKTVQRLGGNESIQADVRILAATNRNLEQAIGAGTFREDLFHRLNVVTIRLPALRERQEDIPLLVDYFLDRFAHELNVERPSLPKDALTLLLQHTWPGNVRELENFVRRLLIFAGGHPIREEDVSSALEASSSGWLASSNPNEALRLLVQRYLRTFGGSNAYEQLLSQIERFLLLEALHQTGGNQTRAASLLGLTRPTLHAKLKKYGISIAPNCQIPDTTSGI